jgi:glutaminyl-tRNA synthetase
MPAEPTAPAPAPSDFIRDIVAGHVAEKRYAKIVTRFPPEPNGYLHIGHAKSICLNFGIAREHQGQCNLRFDDTNPVKEDVEYVESITRDVQWLIAGWADQCLGFKPKGAHPAKVTSNGQPDYYLAPVAPGANSEAFFASDYFDQLYDYAVELIKRGKAYVCDLSPEDTEKYRGSPDTPGKDSPFRNRSVAENLDLFTRMKAGEFPDGTRSLRSKIDMASPNMWLRDPLLYRIRHVAHHHAGDKWCLYPLYDYRPLPERLPRGHHPLHLHARVRRPPPALRLDSRIARPAACPAAPIRVREAQPCLHPRLQTQAADPRHREGRHGWDDPRMPTLSGLRRRGIPASALRAFVTGVGVTKFDSLTEAAVFENAVRGELNTSAARRLAVLKPIKLVLTNIAAGETVECTATNNPQDENPTTRPLALTREVFIETDDFAEVPPPKYFRLKPGGEVRLKYACIIKCDELVKDASGAITEIRCTAQLDTRSGQPNADKKVKGTIHWVSADKCIDAEVRLYDRLFTVAEPAAEDDFLKVVNPKSLEIVTAKLEASLATAKLEDRYQFERLGYFSLDAKDSRLLRARCEGHLASQARLQPHDHAK